MEPLDQVVLLELEGAKLSQLWQFSTFYLPGGEVYPDQLKSDHTMAPSMSHCNI